MARKTTIKAPPVKKAKPKSKSKSSSGGVPSDVRIVQAIASRAAFGEDKPSRKLIMGLAVMTNEKSFNTTLLNMKKKKGWIEYDRDSVWLTQKGRDYVGESALSVPQTNDAMQDKIREDMVKGKKPREIFDLMLDGEWHSRDELADALNLPNNKSFGTYVSALSKVTERGTDKKIRLKDMCFPCGRP